MSEVPRAAKDGSSAQATSSAVTYELPWVEKYRPTRLDDVVGNSATVDRLKVIQEDGNCPHLLISGLPGIGKTTSVHCLAHALLGDAYKEGVLELNASDERGIDVVRNKIKNFAQKKVTLPPGRHKIIILDEADSMTPGAQQALRRTMEIYANTTRFCFACNQSNKIIDPIQSRCAILRYGKLRDEEVMGRLKEICKLEDVKYSAEGLGALVFTSEGDMRQAINNLQSTWTGLGFVSPDNVFKVCDQPHPVVIRQILLSCNKGDVDSAMEKLDELWTQGYAAVDIVTGLFRVVKTIDQMPEALKLDFIREIGWTHMRVLEGVSTLIQLGGLVARLAKIHHPKEQFLI
ncbi:putative RFC4-DNA replication factor C, 37 kDa subunit [Ceraceosorus guamensis]|uniref:Replication factor C subunit 4 n=1 Tax=Ceraceosorus guamensis TaxID=1522189 RepID=A0A316W8Y7_9BASI|nr:putative RFC4-DNA replication factor C, 37 kDa subunit [Ceraceosorus guamensis]PWN46034.1 putative RFC4-DNA replication factor C, 37 kDa subunit [Ceraceosorus guamensis]